MRQERLPRAQSKGVQKQQRGSVGVYKARLAAGGIDVPHCEAFGQLEVVSWREAYLQGDGEFDKERMLATVDHRKRPANPFLNVRA